MCKVTIVDSIMGSGKTTWCIDYIKENRNENILYITPFLKEADRIADGCKEVRDFQKPVNKGRGKVYSLNEMLLGQADIVATHELFKHMDVDSREYILAGKYTLILDETLNVVEPFDVQKTDVPYLLKRGDITINEDGFVIWNSDETNYDTRYNDIKLLAEKHLLMYVNETMLVWRYPPEIFKLFEKVYILTYLFDASILRYYFDVYGLQYEKKSVRFNDTGKAELVEYYVLDTAEYAKLLNVYDGNLNENFYQKISSMSLSWYDSPANAKYVKKLKQNLLNYFQHIIHAKSETIMWTTYKKHSGKLKGKGYTKGFVPCNCRSTNEYSDRSNLAYAVNIYMHPALVQFFANMGVEVDQDMYALSEMLQWIWRSRIRNGQAVNIYVPADRMRILLLQWMGQKVKRQKIVGHVA